MLPLDAQRQPRAAALAAAAGAALAGHLSRSGWLAKDVVLLFADGAACGALESAEVRRRSWPSWAAGRWRDACTQCVRLG